MSDSDEEIVAEAVPGGADGAPPAEDDSDENNDKKGKKRRKKKGKKGGKDKQEKLPFYQEYRNEMITGGVNAILLISAAVIFIGGVLIAVMPRIRNTEQKGTLEMLPKLSPTVFAAVVLSALMGVLTSIFGMCGVCCTKNAPDCSRCCMCVNLVMALISTILFSLAAIVSAFLFVNQILRSIIQMIR